MAGAQPHRPYVIEAIKVTVESLRAVARANDNDLMTAAEALERRGLRLQTLLSLDEVNSAEYRAAESDALHRARELAFNIKIEASPSDGRRRQYLHLADDLAECLRPFLGMPDPGTEESKMSEPLNKIADELEPLADSTTAAAQPGDLKAVGASDDIQAVKNEIRQERERQAAQERRYKAERRFLESCCIIDFVVDDDAGWLAWEKRFYDFAVSAVETGRSERLDGVITVLQASGAPRKRIVGELLRLAQNRGPAGEIARTLCDANDDGHGFLNKLRDELFEAIRWIRYSNEQFCHFNNAFVATRKIASTANEWLKKNRVPQEWVEAAGFMRSVNPDVIVLSDSLHALEKGVGEFAGWPPEVIEQQRKAVLFLCRISDIPLIPISNLDHAILSAVSPAPTEVPDNVTLASCVCNSIAELASISKTGLEALQTFLGTTPAERADLMTPRMPANGVACIIASAELSLPAAAKVGGSGQQPQHAPQAAELAADPGVEQPIAEVPPAANGQQATRGQEEANDESIPAPARDGGWYVEVDSARFWFRRKPYDLSGYPLKLLDLFVKLRLVRCLNYDRLKDAWGEYQNDATDGTIKNHIFAVRTALKAVCKDESIQIEDPLPNVRGAGWEFAMPRK